MQKTPLPCSYALAIGPNEGKEGSKAFWSEPLEKGNEKAADAKPTCSSTPVSASNPTGKLWGKQGMGSVLGEALVSQSILPWAIEDAAQLTLLRCSS